MKRHAKNSKELLEELRQLVADAEKLLSTSASERSKEALDALRKRYAATQEKLSGLYDGAKEKVADGVKVTDKAIRKNPYRSLAAAICGGVVLGTLVGRGRGPRQKPPGPEEPKDGD